MSQNNSLLSYRTCHPYCIVRHHAIGASSGRVSASSASADATYGDFTIVVSCLVWAGAELTLQVLYVGVLQSDVAQFAAN